MATKGLYLAKSVSSWRPPPLFRRTQQILLLSSSNSARFQSSTAAATATTATSPPPPPPPPPALPPLPPSLTTNEGNKEPPSSGTKRILHSIPLTHSRKAMPLIVKDPIKLAEWTQEVLETPDSRLFAHLYKPTNNTSQWMIEHRDAAWATADPVVQKVEALIRGYAHAVRGTIWNRLLRNHWRYRKPDPETGVVTPRMDPVTAMNWQHKLLRKIHNEGFDYMTVRNMDLEERYGPKPPSDPNARKPWEKPPKQMPGKGILYQFPLDAKKYTTNNMLDVFHEHHPEERDDADDEDEDYDSDDEPDRLAHEQLLQLSSSTTSSSKDTLHEEWFRMYQDDSYLHDFALPGPTVNMYDTILDTLACSAAQHSIDPVQDLATATNVYEMVILRHFLDGGDYATDVNVHTRPTILTFNAQIRLAAQLPWQEGNSIEHRDDALTVAMAAFSRTHECGVVERNASSHTYLIQCLHKYMPPSRIRGDMALALVMSARYHGILSQAVIEAFKACNIPSNAKEHDELILEKFTGENYMAKLPKKWFRLNKKRRYDSREEVY